MKKKERMTKAQLIAELEECYRRIAEVEVEASQSAERLSEKSLWAFQAASTEKKVRILHTKKIACSDQEGKPQYLLGISEDITERLHLEESLRESEKLAATSRLAAGIAHEINNPLAGIKQAFHLVKGAIPGTHPHYQYVNAIDVLIDRIAAIVRQLYQLYPARQEVAHAFELGPVIFDTFQSLEVIRQAYEVTLTLNPLGAHLRISLPEHRFRQTISHLIRNAIEASPQGGEITVAGRLIEGSLQISVADHGPGISEDIQPRIFEPFFSTKNNQQQANLGLGLSVSRSLTQAMGGELQFETRQGQGTVFFARFPLPSLSRPPRC